MSLSEAKKKLLAQRLAGKRGVSVSAVGSSIPRRRDDAEGCIAPGQRPMWFQYLAVPESPAYTISSGYHVEGKLEIEKVEHAANAVIVRHEILRSIFIPDNETARLQVLADFRLKVELFPVTGGDALQEIARREACKPFKLGEKPAVRLIFVREESGSRGLLVLLVHHCIFDEWSLGIFWKEFLSAWRGVSLPVLPIQFADYAHWQRENLESSACAKQLNYWKEQLTPLPEPLSLPSDRRRSLHSSDAGAVETLEFDARLGKTITELAARFEVSPFVTFLLAFEVLLHRYTGRDDIVVGTPVANRNAPELVDLIGFFLSTVAIRNDFSSDPSVEKALKEMQRTVLAAFDHLEVPFDQVVDALQPQRTPGTHPIFQVMFVYEREDETTANFELGDAQLSSTLIDTQAAKFDLTLFIVERGGGLQAFIEYRTDHFDAVTIQRMLGHYRQLLEAMVQSPGVPVSQLNLLPQAESDQILNEWQGGALAIDCDVPVVDHIVEAARGQSMNFAIIDGDSRLTYAELMAKAGAIASMLESSDFVALFMGRGADAIAGIIGIQLAGAAYVPIDPSYPVEHWRHMMEDCGAKVVVTHSSQAELLRSLDAKVICVDDPGEGTPDYESQARSDAAAYMIYTSGSTGRPKGVVVNHGNLAWSTAARNAVYQDSPERFLLIPSLSFDSSVAGIFWTLANGGTLVIMPDKLEQDIAALAALIATEKVTHMLCLPSLYEVLLQFAQREQLTSLKTVIVAGESCSERIVSRHVSTLPHTMLYNEYGPTETTVWCTVQNLSAAPDRVVSIGKPLPGAEIYLLDKMGQLVPQGVPGEIHIGGKGVTPGYHQRPDLTADRFITNPFGAGRLYRTGDLARYDRDGSIIFLGRVDGQVKVRGHRIETGEIESLLREQPGIGDAAVLARIATPVDILCSKLGELSPEVAERLLEELEQK